MKLLRNLVTIRRIEKENKTESGIIMSIQPQEKSNEGIVENVGAKVLELKVGQKVRFKDHFGHEIEPGLLMMKEDDVLLILG
jgi:co-chaperonin GroES (HSP10)